MSDHRRVLLIVIDAARREETHEALATSDLPVLRDAARATLIAPSCWTVPCVASMLTGLFPSEHGLQWPLRSPAGSLVTIADLLERAGRTFRLLSGNNLCGPPLLPLRDDQVYRPHDRWRPVIAVGRTLTGMDYGSRAILREVGRMAEDDLLPDMLMLHLQEPHHPYLAPPRGLDPIGRARYAFGHLAYYFRTSARTWEGAVRAEADAWQERRRCYRECLEYAVGIVEDAMRAYDRCGALNESLVIVTADHGEHLGEHGLADHQASLHEELVNCPCAVVASDLGPGAAIPGQFQHTDLLTTICSWLGVETDGYRPGRPARDILAGDGGHEHAFMEWSAWGPEELGRLRRRNPGFDFEPLRRDLAAVRTERWKYIRSGDGGEYLYDLRDPGEARSVCTQNPGEVAELGARIDRWQERMRRSRDAGTSEPMSALDRRAIDRRLRGLGYL